MARRMTAKQRRFFGKRRTTRRVSSSARRAPRRKSGKNTQMMQFLAAGLYGAGRGRLSQFISPLSARIPAGNIADEVGMLAALWTIKKFGARKVPMLGQVAKVGMFIEWARIGEAVATGQLNLTQTTSNNNGGVTLFV